MKTARQMERAVLFEQLSTKLSERDRLILVLLLQDVTSPANVAAALGVSYSAAAKAIQRVKVALDHFQEQVEPVVEAKT